MSSEDKTSRTAIAARLRMAREAAGLSQGQAAKLMGMHRPTVSEIEAGGRMMVLASRKDLVLSAISQALRLRKAANIPLSDAVCPFDLAEQRGVEVRFQALASFDGMRGEGSDGSAIIVSSLRPPGRRAFTCAHELGHAKMNRRKSSPTHSPGFSSCRNLPWSMD